MKTRSIWAIAVGMVMIGLTPVFGMVLLHTWPLPTDKDVLDRYQVLAVEGADSPKVAKWFGAETVANFKAAEKEFGRPTEMYRPDTSRYLFGGYAAHILVRRGKTWCVEYIVSSKTGQLSVNRAYKSGKEMIYLFQDDGTDIVDLKTRKSRSGARAQ